MGGVNEVDILSIYSENIHYHLPDKFWQGKYLSENRMAAELRRRCNIKGDTNS